MARTRSASAHKKVLEAAINLVAENGVDATSMDSIAAASGVSKATIYKHWADKDALLLEAMAELSGLHKRPIFDSGNTRADMIAVLAYQPEDRPALREKILPHFVAYSFRNPEFGHSWRSKMMEPPRTELKLLLMQAIRRGELAPNLDLEFSLALLLGPLIYRRVFLKGPQADKKPPEDLRPLAEHVVDTFWRAFRPTRLVGMRKP